MVLFSLRGVRRISKEWKFTHVCIFLSLIWTSKFEDLVNNGKISKRSSYNRLCRLLERGSPCDQTGVSGFLSMRLLGNCYSSGVGPSDFFFFLGSSEACGVSSRPGIRSKLHLQHCWVFNPLCQTWDWNWGAGCRDAGDPVLLHHRGNYWTEGLLKSRHTLL